MRASLCVAALSVLGCQGSEATTRFREPGVGFSCELPPAWSAHHERGSIVFTNDADPHRTFVVRVVDRGAKTEDGAWLKATDVVVNGLPDVQITDTRPVTGALPGTTYDLSFVPPGATQRYRRSHTTLLGESHVFHVIETEPATSSSDHALVTRLIGSLREEV